MNTPADPDFILAYTQDKSIPTMTPFSCGSEAMDWMSHNCENCGRAYLSDEGDDYEVFDRKLREGKECPLKYAIESGFITSEIRMDIAREIVPEGKELTAWDLSHSRCAHYCLRYQTDADGVNPVPEDPSQLKLFEI